jgi:hypothetical protein
MNDAEVKAMEITLKVAHCFRTIAEEEKIMLEPANREAEEMIAIHELEVQRTEGGRPEESSVFANEPGEKTGEK